MKLKRGGYVLVQILPTPRGVCILTSQIRLGCFRGRCSHCPCGARHFLLLLQNNWLWCHAKLCHAVPSDLVKPPMGLRSFSLRISSIGVINISFGAFERLIHAGFPGCYMNLPFRGLAGQNGGAKCLHYLLKALSFNPEKL